MRNAEYDAFGPWIIEIDEKNPLPKAFEGYLDREEYEMLIKVPRDIDRRDAKPGMDLYDYVIGVYGNNICIIKREDRGIRKKNVNVKDIHGIKDYQNLLVGELSLFMEDDIVTFKYNTVSSDIILRFIMMIRGKYIDKDSMITHDTLEDHHIKKLEIFYLNKLNHLKKHEDNLKIISLQPSSKISYSDCSLLKRMYYRLRGNSLQSSLYLSNQKEIIILQRGKKLKAFRQTDYSYTYTYIPYNRIRRVKTEFGETTSEIEKVMIKTDKYTFDCLFMSDNHYKRNLYNNLQFIGY